MLLVIADINECHNVSFGENATCTDEVGNYSCECESGFTGDGYNYCTGMIHACTKQTVYHGDISRH